MTRTSEYRRHNKNRVIKNRLNNIHWVKSNINYISSKNDMSDEQKHHRIHKTLGLINKTPKPCSCHMCGNPRRHYKGKSRKTIKEVVFDDVFLDGLNEFWGD